LKILLMRGLPCSGKSTYAKKLVEDKSHYKRINRDLLREMIDGRWSDSKEKTIRKAELALAELFLTLGFTPIIDDCNLSPHAMHMWQDFATKMKATIEIKDFTDVPLDVCIERDRHRQHYVGEQVIRKMYHDFLQPKPVEIVHDPTLPDAILCDIDGTLALLNGRNPYNAAECENDIVNEPVSDIVGTYYKNGYTVILASGRSEEHREQTERWLAKHAIPYHALFMRPLKDSRQDAIIKREIYEQHIQGKYSIKFVLDDRVQVVGLWRSLGLTCLQVAEGDF